jgi:DNA-binding CsgD family transcriptional regulator
MTYPFSEEFATAFLSGNIFGSDPRMPMFLGAKPGTIYFDRALFDVEAMNHDPRCIATNEALGTKYSLGARLDLPGGLSGIVSLFSSEAEGHASGQAIQSFRRLAPHLRQAVSLGQIVDGQAVTRDLLLDALARRADGVILLDHVGRPSFVNDAARAILAMKDGLSYARGAFAAQRGPETRALQCMISQAFAIRPPSDQPRAAHEVLITRSSGKRPYIVRAMPAPRTERFLSRVSIAGVLHVHDLAAERIPPRGLLIGAFGLTEREADLAIELVRSTDLATAAERAKMSFNTARNHLASIFRKCSVSSQAEAIQLFERLA